MVEVVCLHVRLMKTRKMAYSINLVEITSWPPSTSLIKNQSVFIQWKHGEKNIISGRTKTLHPSKCGGRVGDGYIKIDESFTLDLTLSSVKPGERETFVTNCIKFDLREKTVKEDSLATAAINFAKHPVQQRLEISVPMTCTMNPGNTVIPELVVKILQVVDQEAETASQFSGLSLVGSSGSLTPPREIMAMIKDVNPMRQTVSIRVKVLVSWRQLAYRNIPETQEFIFMDETADKIQASIKANFYDDFKPLLYEGSTIVVDGFSVAANTSKYAVIQNKYKVLILKSTKINSITDFQEPKNAFRFTSFQDIVSKKDLKNQDTLHIIGSIVYLGEVVKFTKNGSLTKCITVYLRDLESVSIKCTLFGEFAEQLEVLHSKADSTSHAILVVQFAKINDYPGNLSVTNAIYGTRVFLNADIPEIEKFLLDCPQGQPAFVRYNAINSQTGYSSPDDFFKGCKPIALSDITDHHKEACCVTLATIDSIQDVSITKQELRQCPNPGNGLKCGDCGADTTSSHPRYMVHVCVLDDTGSASFTLFNQHVQMMVTVSASDPCRKMVVDDVTFLDDLNILIGKKLLFKVEVSKYNIRENHRYYTVLACTDDVGIILEYKNMLELNTATMSDAHIQALKNENVAIPLANRFAKDVVSVTADNGNTIDLTKSTADSSPAKRNENQFNDKPLSVKKANKRVLHVK